MRLPTTDLKLVALSFAGLLLLHGFASWTEPALVSLSETAAHEGARVVVEGFASEVRHGARGRAFVLLDASARAVVLAPPGEGPRTGDLVRVVGIVSRLDDGLGISAESVEVVAPVDGAPVSPADLAREPERFTGARVFVRGEVRGDALVGGGARVRLAGEAAPEREGQWLAAGTFRYHTLSASYVLSVDAWTRP